METTVSGNKSQVSAKSSSPVVHQIADRVEDLKEKTKKTYDSSIEVVRKNPVTSLATALGVGVAIGYVLRRRH